MASLTETVQAALRSATGKALTYNGDWHTYADLLSIPQGMFAERILAIAKSQGLTFNSVTQAYQYYLANPSAIVGVKVFDISSAIPAGITFTRAGSRNYTNSSNVQTVATTDVPCFDYTTGGVSLGLSIQDATSNACTYSNTFNNAIWQNYITMGLTAGQASPDGGTNAWLMVPAASAGNQKITHAKTIVSGHTYTYFTPKVKAAGMDGIQLLAGSTTTGMSITCRFGTNPMFYTKTLGADFSNVYGGMIDCGGGWYQFWLTGTSAVTVGDWYIAPLRTTSDSINYTGNATDGIYIFESMMKEGIGYTAPITTTNAAASVVADVATITDISWLNSAQGTFVIETDIKSGTLLGSDTNVVVSSKSWNGKGLSKVAFAWDGTTSDLVANGEATTTGTVPTFSTTLTLLGTSAAKASGHIKSITYYPVRKTVAQMQALTKPAPAAATVGAWRTIAYRNKIPSQTQALTGTVLNFAFRFQCLIGSADVAKIKASLGNFYAYTDTVGNSVVIDAMALEKVTGSLTTPITFSASRTITLADGDADIKSDEILPAAFSASVCARGEVYWIKGRGHVASTGQKIPVSRSKSEITGTQAFVYDPVATTLSSTDTFGSYTWTGTAPTDINFGFSPIMIGVYNAVDPATFGVAGDSLIAGPVTNDGGWVQHAMVDADGTSNPLSSIEYSLGGSTQVQWAAGTKWKTYLGYHRVMIEDHGDNDVNADYPSIQSLWKSFRDAGNQEIIRPSLLMLTSSTDSWATEANQTVGSAAGYAAMNGVFAEAAVNGFVNHYDHMDVVRGVDPTKWKVNGTPFYMTIDGDHYSAAAQLLLSAEGRILISQINIATS